MKALVWFLTIMLFCPSWAVGKDFKFTWKTADSKIEYSTKADSWEEAIERASKYCANLLRNGRKNLTEDQKLDIIDVCVNPR